jgi:hypothetical protein
VKPSLKNTQPKCSDSINFLMENGKRNRLFTLDFESESVSRSKPWCPSNSLFQGIISPWISVEVASNTPERAMCGVPLI